MPTIDAHDREYAAAVAYLCEQTICPGRTVMHDGNLLDTWQVGDRVKFLEDGHTLYGVVVERMDLTTYRIRRHVPDVGNQTHIVDAAQMLPF